eukprot:2993969-Pleurochrysis_carterae.AAC.1
MEGSTRGGEVCGFLTYMLVVRGPWRRELFRPLGVWTVRRDEGASERAGSRSSKSGKRHGLESAAAQCLHRCRGVSCARAACDA